MSQVTLQDVYDRVLLRETVVLEPVAEKDFNNLRTSLLRKFRKSKEEFQACGLPWPYSGEFIECRYKRDTFTAEFKLSLEVQRRTRSVVFTLKDV